MGFKGLALTPLDDKQLAQLGEHVAMENWEKRLLPLFQFKGTKPYRIRALWNAAYGMFLAEAPTLGAGARTLALNSAEHLCGLHRTPQMMYGFFSRMHFCKDLTDSVSKEFTEYIRWIFPNPFRLKHVPLQTSDFREGVTAWWRTGIVKKRVWKDADVKPAERQYPYITRGGQKEHELLLKVHSFIPSTVPHAIRGDLCQDLIVAVLSADITVENIPDTIARYIRDAKKIMPDIWGRHTVSLDEVIPGTDGLRRWETVSKHRYSEDFAPELIERITQSEEDHAVPAVRWRQNGIDPTREVAREKTGLEKGDVVRLTADALRRLPLVAQSRIGQREGILMEQMESARVMVRFPETEFRKETLLPVYWDWLEAAHTCDLHCDH